MLVSSAAEYSATGEIIRGRMPTFGRSMHYEWPKDFGHISQFKQPYLFVLYVQYIFFDKADQF